MEVRVGADRLEPKVKGRLKITDKEDYVFPDWEYFEEFPDDMPRASLEVLGDLIKRRNAMIKKVPTIGKYEYKPPSILMNTDETINKRTGKLVYNAEPTTQDKALKKYHHYASKYGIPISTKDRGKKTLAELAKEINAYEHNPKNMARILKQPIDVKFKERGLYLVDV
jgi:hypothetical protein